MTKQTRTEQLEELLAVLLHACKEARLASVPQLIIDRCEEVLACCVR